MFILMSFEKIDFEIYKSHFFFVVFKHNCNISAFISNDSVIKPTYNWTISHDQWWNVLSKFLDPVVISTSWPSAFKMTKFCALDSGKLLVHDAQLFSKLCNVAKKTKVNNFWSVQKISKYPMVIRMPFEKIDFEISKSLFVFVVSIHIF